MSLSVNLERVYLLFDGMTIDDDMLGASIGDGDGLIEYGETIELTPRLVNVGQVDAFDVSADVTTDSPDIEMLEGQIEFGDIPSGSCVAGLNPCIFHVNPYVANCEILEFECSISEEPGWLTFQCEALAPAYILSISEIDDSGGDGDGIPDPGETVVLTLRIENAGDSDSPDLEAVLQSQSTYFVPEGCPHALGVLSAHETYWESGFTVEIAPDCPTVFEDYLELVLNGPNDYVVALPLHFCVGHIFSDDMEAGDELWTHYAGPGDWYDQWHITNYDNHTAEGQYCWKCGGGGGIGYANRSYSILETVAFELPTRSRLEFWHRMGAQANPVNPGGAFDGGLLEISMDGGLNWEPLEPVGGYTHVIETGTPPYPLPEGTPVWSGSFDWTQASVYLGDYVGTARLRWIFGSDASGVSEGWFIDDVHVSRPPASGVEIEMPIKHPILYPVRPNPAFRAAGGIAVRFHLPRASEGHLAILDASGRLQKVLASGRLNAGDQRLIWNGRNARGANIPAGCYFLRLTVGESATTQPVIILR